MLLDGIVCGVRITGALGITAVVELIDMEDTLDCMSEIDELCSKCWDIG